MLPPRIEVASGPINGANKKFATVELFVPGSLVVLLNGVALEGTLDNGWTETGGNEFTVKEAPIVGDVIQAFYRPVAGFAPPC